MRLLISLIIACLCINCSGDDIPSTDVFVGIWKVEGSEQYEIWEFTNDTTLSGYSYSLEDGEKKITETIAIRQIDDNIVFEATVPDQNDGNTIPFTMNRRIKDYYSFENPEHDFPKKIQYNYISSDTVEVTVLGDQDEGFTFKMIKQD